MLIMNVSAERVLHEAIHTLLSGGVVAYPTETFYGLGVKFDREKSLERLYSLKKRPVEKALPLIIGDRELLSQLSPSVGRTALSLMENFWPGPLTLILPALGSLSRCLTAGSHTVAVRMPGDSFALRLARAAGFPITATSANISGAPPATDIKTIIGYFDDSLDLIIDGGTATGDLPSTIVDVTGERPRILREGALKREHMAAYFMPG
jgi:L-threonylcarbamoyladenylate synthase